MYNAQAVLESVVKPITVILWGRYLQSVTNEHRMGPDVKLDPVAPQL